MEPVAISQKSLAHKPVPANVADGLEQVFMAEMLKHVFPDEDNGFFGGGIGEQQMRSLLIDAYSQKVSARTNWL